MRSMMVLLNSELSSLLSDLHLSGRKILFTTLPLILKICSLQGRTERQMA